MTTSPARIGVIGCGNISAVYFKAGQALDILDVVACADLDMDRARARAAECDVPRACTVEELLADPEVEIVLNLTIPRAHGEVGLAALESGKHVYNEKPLALSREDGRRMLEMARRNASLALTARGMPVDLGYIFVLWASDDRSSMQVGRFMVDRSGSCRARFNLPEDHAWTRFWVTEAGTPAVVVAST